MLCDLNCDMGEGGPTDAAIMPYITAANIACGYHAGDEETMRQTILSAKEHGVAIGAHPSFADRQNFGRTAMNCTPQEVYDLVIEQIKLLEKMAAEQGVKLHHVKPHGALYNAAAKDKTLARAIAQAVKDRNENLVLYGLSGSYLVSEAKEMHLATASEVFADRTYQDDGTLTPRTHPEALIENEQQMISHVLQMVNEKKVTTLSGKKIPIIAETVCIHGDGVHAVRFAKVLNNVLKEKK